MFRYSNIFIFVSMGFLYFILWSSPVQAGCVCSCVNGNPQALCSSTLDLPPICSPRICPIVPPSIEPLQSLRLNPLGTTSCRQAQVLNPYTLSYEWKRVCQ